MRAALVLLGSTLVLAACEGGGDPVQQALREEASINHAEVALAREEQAARRAEADQTEIARLEREIALAEAALNGTRDEMIRAEAQATINANRAALAAIAAER